MTAYFITLTYDTSHVPFTKKGFMQITKRDLQLFFKRLRKLHEGNKLPSIKYYACGEYGGKTMRPHYHVILFNAQLELIQPAWNLGNVHYGEVNEASVGYTLKYMCKPSKIPLHRNDDRTPEFSLMSKRLGLAYLSNEMRAWHKADPENRMYVNLLDGKKASMPRYYKELLYTEEEKERASDVQRKRIAEEKEKAMRKAGKSYYRNKFESHLSQKTTFKKNADQRSKI